MYSDEEFSKELKSTLEESKDPLVKGIYSILFDIGNYKKYDYGAFGSIVPLGQTSKNQGFGAISIRETYDDSGNHFEQIFHDYRKAS